MKFLNSLKIKFTIGVFVIVTVVTAVLSVVSYIYEKRMVEDRVYSQLNSVADLKKQLLVDYVNERKNDLKLMATSDIFRKHATDLLAPSSSAADKRSAAQFVFQRFAAFKGVHPGYRWLTIVDLRGNVIINSENKPGSGSHSRPPERQTLSLAADAVKQNDALILQDVIEKGQLGFARAMRSKEGKLLALIISRVDLTEEFFPAFTDYSGLGGSGEALLVTQSNGRVMHLNPTRYPISHGRERGNPGDGRPRLSRRVLSGIDGIETGLDYRGETVIGAYRYIPVLQWGVIAKIDSNEAFEEIARLRNRRISLSLGILTIVLAIVFIVVRNFTDPIAELTQKTRAVTAGRFSMLVKSGRKDEIGELEENFNQMVIALDAAGKAAGMKQEDLENKVRERTEHLARALEDIKRETAEKKALQAQLLHSQKMEAVGTLAGGIAHDFNNLLTAITGYGNIMRNKLKDNDPLREYLNHILTASDRAAGLTHSLLAFSRKQIITPRPMNVNECIGRVEKLLTRLIGEDIELRVKPCDRELIILADPGQIEQVMMNLATNARDAMPSGGCFTIATAPTEIDERYIALHGYGETGKYAAICVSDTGAGMDEATRTRIFEPFFTTKEPGKGTGLGLSIVYGIVKTQNGYINCYSEPGKGTTFKIYMPLIGEAIRAECAETAREARGGNETILVAEDNKEVRGLIRTILTEQGYKVLEAEDGVAAVECFLANSTTVALLVLDVVMPRKNGKDVYDEISRLRPGVKAIFTSGYTDDIIRKQGLLDAGPAIVPKPISPRDLLLKIRDALDDGHPPGERPRPASV